MDKELAKLQKEIIKRLIAYEDELTALKSQNTLKKTRRVAGSVAWNIAAFPDLVQNLLDSGVPTSKIVTSLKYFQEKLLKDIEQIKGTETGHHKVGLRTGGSFYRADPEIWQPTVARLADFFQAEFGDVIPNIDSLLNWTHKSDANVKGIERALNIGANPNRELTAHPLGTASKFISGDLPPEVLTDPDKLFDALAARIDQQLQAAKIARTVQQPLEQAVQTFAEQAYRAPTLEVSKQVQALTALPENRSIIEQGILETVQGSIKLNKAKLAKLAAIPALGGGMSLIVAGQQAMAGDLSEAAFTVGTGVIGEVPVVGDVAAEFIEGTPVASGELTPAKADPQVYVKQALQEKAQRGKEFSEFVQLAKQRPSTTINPKELERQRRAEAARQRGGKLKVGFGGVKFALPEFGLSELMGIN